MCSEITPIPVHLIRLHTSRLTMLPTTIQLDCSVDAPVASADCAFKTSATMSCVQG